MGKKTIETESTVEESLLSQVNELTAAIEQQKEISAGHQKINAELSSEIESLKSEKESLKKEIEVLLKGDGAVAKEKASGIGGTFDFDGKKYKILLHAATIPGIGRRTALEILNDTDAQAKLVASGSGVITEVS